MRSVLLFLLIFCVSCRKDPPLLPGTSLLVFPANNEVCADGSIISADESIILFRWKAAENAESYTLNIKNLETGAVLSQSTDKTQLQVTLNRSSPYSWYVNAVRAGIETSSDTWKFYNPGPALTSYSPFPADLVSLNMRK